MCQRYRLIVYTYIHTSPISFLLHFNSSAILSSLPISPVLTYFPCPPLHDPLRSTLNPDLALVGQQNMGFQISKSHGLRQDMAAGTGFVLQVRKKSE